MSAVDRAREMRGPVETFDGFAHLEVAAIDDERRLAALVAICDDAMEASQALLATQPADPEERPKDPPAGLGLLGALLRMGNDPANARRARQQEARDAWWQRVEALEADATGRVATWREAVDAAWLAAATSDRDAALELLVQQGSATREMADIVRGHPFGDLLLRAALAHD